MTRSGLFSWKRLLLLAAFVVSMLYGVSYQQFRHFDISDPRGANDAADYLRMSHHDYNVSPTRRYRFVVPELARLIRPLVRAFVTDPAESDILCFYVVNFAITTATTLLFFSFLTHCGFEDFPALIGVSIFLCSRMTIFAAALPLVDSFYYFAIVCVLLSIQAGRINRLVWFIPVLALSKETIFPVVVLPLFTHRAERKKLAVSLVAAAGAVGLSRYLIALIAQPENQRSLWAVIYRHTMQLETNLRWLFSFRGLHDLQAGMSLFLLLGFVGFVLYRDHPRYQIHRSLLLIVPLTFCYGLLSHNLGRMFFPSIFVVIPYTLIIIEEFFVHRNAVSGRHVSY